MKFELLSLQVRMCVMNGRGVKASSSEILGITLLFVFGDWKKHCIAGNNEWGELP